MTRRDQRLSELGLGARGVLGAPTRVNATIVRLLELGMTEGAEIELTRRAPGGDPLEVRLRGTRLCLRKAEAAEFPVSTPAAVTVPGHE